MPLPRLEVYCVISRNQGAETMTLTIQLNPEQEARLTEITAREGLDPAEVATKLVIEHLPPAPPDEVTDPMLALFAQWEKEDQNITPEEIAEENRTWEQFK